MDITNDNPVLDELKEYQLSKDIIDGLLKVNPDCRIYDPESMPVKGIKGFVIMPQARCMFLPEFIPNLLPDMELDHSKKHNSYEFFVIIGNEKDRDTYFKEQFDGLVSTIVCKKFNYFEDGAYHEKEINRARYVAAINIASNYPKLANRILNLL